MDIDLDPFRSLGRLFMHDTTKIAELELESRGGQLEREGGRPAPTPAPEITSQLIVRSSRASTATLVSVHLTAVETVAFTQCKMLIRLWVRSEYSLY